MKGIVNYRPTRAIVDLEAIRTNVGKLKDSLPKETGIIAVVKADGYGHGATKTAMAAFQAGAMMAAVATPEEALSLRQDGISQPILVMGPTPIAFLQEAIRKHVTVTIPSLHWLEDALKELADVEGKLKVHVKIDTGMGRIGIRTEQELAELLRMVEHSPLLEIEGAFTHFATADEANVDRTRAQFNEFLRMVKCFKKRPPLLHVSNSAAALRFPEYALDAVRMGISMYGISPSEVVRDVQSVPLSRALQLETEIAYVKQAKTNEPISYGGTYVATPGEWIATLPIGYADGVNRGLRNQEVLVRGKRVPIVGTICMDQCMIRLSESVPEGESVILIGKQGTEEITMEEWATRLGTIPYEIAVTIATRVPRQYFGE